MEIFIRKPIGKPIWNPTQNPIRFYWGPCQKETPSCNLFIINFFRDPIWPSCWGSHSEFEFGTLSGPSQPEPCAHYPIRNQGLCWNLAEPLSETQKPHQKREGENPVTNPNNNPIGSLSRTFSGTPSGTHVGNPIANPIGNFICTGNRNPANLREHWKYCWEPC